VYHWTTGNSSKETSDHPGETEPLLVKETIIEMPTADSEVWVDEAEEEIPFHKAFLGGIMSSELPEGTPENVAYEVCFTSLPLPHSHA
jgi:hypothetical protein